MSINTPPEPIKIIGAGIYDNLDSLLECRDLVLLLVYVSPLWGATHLQKQVFLLWKMLGNMSVNAGFFAHKFGPYSQVVSDSVKDLKGEGFLREGLGKRYIITNSGKTYIKQKIDRIGIEPDMIARHKIKWDEWNARGITTYVYRLYPDYGINTEVPHLKW